MEAEIARFSIGIDCLAVPLFPVPALEPTSEELLPIQAPVPLISPLAENSQSIVTPSKRTYTCTKCGKPKRGHVCTVVNIQQN